MAIIQLKEKTRKWSILIAMLSASALIYLDVTILPVALPAIQENLGLSDLGLQWIINAYILSFTIFLLAAGRFGDRYGHRKVFDFGLLVFTIGSIFCGMSQGETWFICARLAQGLGAALLSPSGSALTFNAFPKKERGHAFGIFMSVGSIFLALGPFIGGLFSEYWSWRFIFWINIPIGLISYFLTALFVPKTSGNRSHHFDWGGFLTTSFGISSIVIALMQAQKWGWTSLSTLSLILLGALLLIALFWIDRRVKEPYFDFSFFKNRTFMGSCLSIVTTQFILMLTVFWAMYFQNLLGFSPSKAGTLTLLSNAPVIIVAPLGAHLIDKKGARLPLAIGFLLIISSLWWLVQNIDNLSLPILLSAIVPFGCGIPLILTPSITTALSKISPSRRGLAAGTISTLRQLGGTLGLALMGSFFLFTQLGHFAKDLQENKETEYQARISADALARKFEGLLAQSPKAIAALSSFSEEEQASIKTKYKEAYKRGFVSINALGGFMGIVGLLGVFIFIREKNRPQL